MTKCPYCGYEYDAPEVKPDKNDRCWDCPICKKRFKLHQQGLKR